MSAAQKRSYDAFAKDFCIPFAAEKLNYQTIFGNENPVILEIGFGMGIATAKIALDNPEKNYIGIEVHRPGIGRLLWEIQKSKIKNIRVIEHDAAEVIAGMIPPASAAGVHIFFPDPWPKKRHHKRRLVARPFTELLAEKLAAGGYLYMVTDWEDYGNWALEELSATAGLVNAHDGFAPLKPGGPKQNSSGRGLRRTTR
jgi:tRNA (guanine-N7-)-methyltransferase